MKTSLLGLREGAPSHLIGQLSASICTVILRWALKIKKKLPLGLLAFCFVMILFCKNVERCSMFRFGSCFRFHEFFKKSDRKFVNPVVHFWVKLF